LNSSWSSLKIDSFLMVGLSIAGPASPRTSISRTARSHWESLHSKEARVDGAVPRGRIPEEETWGEPKVSWSHEASP
jgi:hypothetical protein